LTYNSDKVMPSCEQSVLMQPRLRDQSSFSLAAVVVHDAFSQE
jgi:hypothetical protein